MLVRSSMAITVVGDVNRIFKIKEISRHKFMENVMSFMIAAKVEKEEEKKKSNRRSFVVQMVNRWTTVTMMALVALTATLVESQEVCGDGPYTCPAGQTCCPDSVGNWGCCPSPNASCCPDHVHCCPEDYPSMAYFSFSRSP